MDTTADMTTTLMSNNIYTRSAAYITSFISLYIIGTVVCYRVRSLNLYRGLSPQYTASRIVSSLHALILTPISIYIIYHALPNYSYAAANTPTETALIEFCVAYFSYDIFHLAIIETDVLFLIHHTICIVFLSSVLYLGHGGLSAVAAILMGEITNPLQSAWWIAKLAANTHLYARLSSIFTYTFLFVRVIIVPLWVADIVMTERGFLAAVNDGKLPAAYGYTWSVMCVLMTVGSWIWSYQVFSGYLKKRGQLAHLKSAPVMAMPPPSSSSVATNGVNKKYV